MSPVMQLLDLAALIFTISKCVGTSKWVTPHDSNFEEQLGYLPEILSYIESETKCISESDHNTECAGAE
jgi:hypothetical protein